MKAKKKRCLLPFLILLNALWFVQSMPLRLSDKLPVRELSLVETPERTYVQIIPGDGTQHRDEIQKEIHTP